MYKFPSLSALALSLLFSLPLLAAEPWDGAPYAADPKALLAAAEAIQPAKPEDGVFVLLDEATVTFDEAGRSTRVERMIFRVLDESAVETWGTIETAWSPWYHQRPEVDARVVTKDGSVHRLDPKSFGASDAQDEPNMFSDTRVLSGPLPAVAPGSVVEQTITYREKMPFYAAGVAGRHTFGRWVETKQSRLTIEHPAALALRLVNKTKPALEPKKSESNGITRLVFETGARPAVEYNEWHLPYDVSPLSYVAWSTGQSWQEVAKSYAKIIDEKVGDLSAIAKYADKAIGNATATREKVDRILAAIERDIRYAGVEFGEGSIVPRTAAETLKNKYGDCKDKATLLVAMLRHAGIPAHAVLIRSGYDFDVDPELPGLGHFNHVIVRVEGDEPLWIDPTDEFARAGELPDSDQGRMVLIAKNDTTTLTKTPMYESAVNRTIETREFWLAEEGKAKVVETAEYFGSDERSMRRYHTTTDRKQLGEGLETYAEQAYLSKKLTKWTASDTRDLTKPFQLRLEMEQATRGMTAGGEAAVAIALSRLTSDLPADFHRTDEQLKEAEAKPRVSDFVFTKPYLLEVRYRLHPPAGYEVRTLPESETVKLATASLTKKFSVETDGTVLATYTFDSGPRRLTAAQYDELRKAIVRTDEDPLLLFYFDQTGRKFLDQGEVGKAVAEFRRLTQLHPKEGIHHADMARALLAGGLGAAARREAKRAVEIDPKSATAHATLGFVLSHDLLGREMRSGVDVPAAIAAYRKAKELDPEDVDIRAQLAMLLQHDNAGTRHGDPARINESIQEYLAFKKDIEDADDEAIDRELMSLYALAERWDDLKSLIAETKDTQAKDAFNLIMLAAKHGGSTAVHASQSVELSKRRDAQQRAGQFLVVLRLYSQAADLIAAAAQGAPNAVTLRQQADMLRKTVRRETLKLDGNDALSLLRQAFIAAFEDMPRAEMTKRFATRAASEVFAEEGVRERARNAEASRIGVKKTIKKKDREASMIADLAVSATEFQQDGDENVGLRLRARTPGGASHGELTMYMVREEGSFRLVASHDSPAEFGLHALRLAEKNELSQARQWLDWAREHTTGGSDDPVATNAFAATWSRGNEASADQIRLAAAMLLPDTKKSSELAIPVLTAARATAAPEQQWRIDQALVQAYGITEQWAEGLAAAERLLEKHPDSRQAFQSTMYMLGQLGRKDEVRQRALDRLAKRPGDVAAQQILGSDALERRAYDDAVKYWSGVLDRANPAPGDYNDRAWATVFAKGDLGKALEDARHAAERAPQSYAILNTLAVVYAEKGDSTEARETFLKSLDLRESDEPGPSDWYVVGRLAENYGIADAAAEAYQKIPKPKRVGGSTYELAQARLAALKK